MKGIDHVTETNTNRAFYLSTHPFEKLVFALSGIRTHVWQRSMVHTFHLPRNFSLSCVLSPVWGYRGKDTHSSEEGGGGGGKLYILQLALKDNLFHNQLRYVFFTQIKTSGQTSRNLATNKVLFLFVYLFF